MDQPQEPTEPRSYHVRFEDGPRAGTETVVLGLDSGEPPDVLLTPDRPDWIYLLAGAARGDGSLPYLWMPETKAVALRRRRARRTRGRDTHSR